MTPPTPPAAGGRRPAGSLVGAAACSDDDDGDDGSDGRPPRRRAPRRALATTRPSAAATTYADLVVAAYDATHRVGRRAADRHRGLRRRPHRGDPPGGQGGLARRPRALRTHRGLPLLRRPDRQPRRRAGGPDQRLAPRRGLHRLRRGRRRRPASSTTPPACPRSPPTCSWPPTRRAARRNISTGWHAIEFLLWGQDLSADGAGARPAHRLHHLAGRRAPRHLPHAPRPAAGRRPHRRARPVGPRGRRLPRGVPRRPEPGGRQHLPQHGRAVAGRARRRAHRRRLRHQGPGGRALLLLRQHHRRHRRQRRSASG